MDEEGREENRREKQSFWLLAGDLKRLELNSWMPAASSHQTTPKLCPSLGYSTNPISKTCTFLNFLSLQDGCRGF